MTVNVPMALAAQNLAEICRAFEQGDLNETLTALFHQTRLDTPAAVDKRVCDIRLLSSTLKAAEEARDAWTQRVKQLKFVEERVEEMTLDIMKHNSVTTLTGTIGNLRCQNNPEALHLEFETYKPHVNNVVDPHHIERFAIPEKYLKKFAAYQLDTAQIKEDLKKGEKFEWASLKRGVHLR